MIDRRTFSTVLLAGAAASVLAPAARSQPQRAVRNVVLVHGAYADGSCWSEVIERLQRAGLNITAVQNPLTSLADDVAATRRVLALQDGPTVLVGHSWGGTVITEAGMDPVVSSLVYVAARAPEVGEDFAALAARFPAPPVSGSLVKSGGFARLSEEAFLKDFASGLGNTKARVLYAAQGCIAETLFASKTKEAAWKTKPSWYAVSTKDRMSSPELQRFLAKRMRAGTIGVESGHLSMITQPKLIADLVVAAASEMA